MCQELYRAVCCCRPDTQLWSPSDLRSDTVIVVVTSVVSDTHIWGQVVDTATVGRRSKHLQVAIIFCHDKKKLSSNRKSPHFPTFSTKRREFRIRERDSHGRSRNGHGQISCQVCGNPDACKCCALRAIYVFKYTKGLYAKFILFTLENKTSDQFKNSSNAHTNHPCPSIRDVSFQIFV